MDFLVISETKLKITLIKEECEKYKIRASSADHETAELRRTLSQILSEAKESVKFDIGNERALIQLYPTPGGGCEIFLTKLTGVGEREKRTISRSDNINTYSKRRSVYEFDTLSSLIAAARAVRGAEGKRCDVYVSDSNHYYITVEEGDVDGFLELEILCEFAHRIPTLPPEVMAERGRMLVKDRGFEIFSKL